MTRPLYIIFMLLLLPLSSCITEGDTGSDPVSVGMTVPPFEVTTLDGEIFSTRVPLKGTTYIIFFNTGCIDCRRELPLLQEQYVASLTLPAAERPRYICISREEGAEEVSRYWSENDLTLPVAACPDRSIYDLFATSGIPRIYTVVGNTVTAIDTSSPI
ncbi:MAG: TlpA family protein disulfide reductase [Muribaculaceae bacterium]|nr:TlpA family protein disulfide reductase [Muribaculaceae bacterium]